MKKNRLSFENFIFYFAILYFIVINLIKISNPILESHPFRQTQTAITAHYLLDNFQFAYITPVLGEPESIPFEFPIYQTIVALIADLSGIKLDAVGRMVALLFSLAILIPLHGIFSRYFISNDFYKLVVAGILFSPVYSFWSGTFMIESTALCLTIFGAFFALKGIESRNLLSFIIALLFLTLAMLQKVTTAIFVYSVVLIHIGIFSYNLMKAGQRLKSIIIFFTSTLPFAFAYLWIFYTDHIKSGNPLAIMRITSQAIGTWNYGTITQRFSEFFYVNTIYQQDVLPNTLFGCLVLFAIKFVLNCENSRLKSFLIVLLFLYITPLFVFTNLYWVHDYYHYSNLIYLICFSYLGFLYSTKNGTLNKFKYYILSASYATSIIMFYINYAPAKFSDMNSSRTIMISDYIRASSDPKQKVVIFGIDWSSEIHYYSQRKGLAVPNWVDQVKIANNLDAYVSDPNPVIVVCSSSYRKFDDVLELLTRKYIYLNSKYDCSFFKKPASLK